MEGRSERKFTTLRNIATPQPESRVDDGEVRILVIHPVAATTRLVRETMESFTDVKVDATADPLHGFEMALQKNYRLFLFAMQMDELSGSMLYELISKAYTSGRGPKKIAPGVVFIREKEDPKFPDELARDVRVKDVLTKPLRIDRLLKPIAGITEVRDPTAGN